MNYLERNQLLIAEIGQNLRLRRERVIAEINREGYFTPIKTTVTSVGSYKSTVLDHDLFVCLKEYTDRTDELLVDRVLFELSLMRAIEQKAPYLLPECPLLYGLVSYRKGKPFGTITEDFSRDGIYPVEQVKFLGRSHGNNQVPIENITKILREITGDSLLSTDEEIRNMCFYVNGKRRIGDFDGIFGRLLYSREIDKRLPIDDLLRDVDKYTLRIDYTLE